MLINQHGLSRCRVAERQHKISSVPNVGMLVYAQKRPIIFLSKVTDQ